MTTQLGLWESTYNLGIEDIDFQHHFFFNLIKRLSCELAQEDNIKYRQNLISELNAYAKFHFISEENIMFRAKYPELNTHKVLHIELIEKLSTKGSMFMITNAQNELDEFFHFLFDWFMHHTKTKDRLFADFLAMKAKQEANPYLNP